MLTEKIVFNIDSRVSNKNIITSRSPIGAIRTTGFNLAFYAIIGASMINLSTKTNYEYSCCVQQTLAIDNNQGSLRDYTPEITIDLLKIENINKIEHIKDFEYDWNGNGGMKFTSESIEMFYNIIKTLVRQPQIAPTGKGSLLMQYEKEDNSLLAFEVTNNRVEKVYIPRGNYELADTEIITENICDRMNKSVEMFYGS